MKAFWHQMLTELRLYTRSVGSLAWSFIFPIFVIFSLGFYFGGDAPVKQFIGLVDEDQSTISRLFFTLLQSEPEQFTIVEGSQTQLDSLLRTGRLSAVLTVPAGFSENAITSGDKISYQLNPYLSGTQPVLKVFIQKVIQDLNLQLVTSKKLPVKAFEEKGNLPMQGGSYVDFLIPGMIGLQIMSACLWGIGFLLINYREKGNLKQLALTPVRKSIYISSFISSRFIFQILQVIFILVCSFWAFPVQMHGSWVAFFVVITLGTLMFMALGFLIASLADTVELAIGINNILFFLMIAMGGVFFSTANLPEWAQWFTGLFPLTHFIEALRGIFNDGTSLFHYWKELAILTSWTLVCFALSIRYFRWY
jgi:ABC-2 type transport system permease protein